MLLELQSPQRRRGRVVQSRLTPQAEAAEVAVEEGMEKRRCQHSLSSALGETVQEHRAVRDRCQQMMGNVALRLSWKENAAEEVAALQLNRCCLH